MLKMFRPQLVYEVLVHLPLESLEFARHIIPVYIRNVSDLYLTRPFLSWNQLKLPSLNRDTIESYHLATVTLSQSNRDMHLLSILCCF